MSSSIPQTTASPPSTPTPAPLYAPLLPVQDVVQAFPEPQFQSVPPMPTKYTLSTLTQLYVYVVI